MTRDGAREARRAKFGQRLKAASAVPYIYRYVSPDKDFKLEVKFRRARVAEEELLSALNSVIENIKVRPGRGSDNK